MWKYAATILAGRKEDTTEAQTLVWLLSAPQFWYGFVACAILVFLALLPTTLFPRRTTIVYTIPERAPVPVSDPFYKPSSERFLTNRTGAALREHRERLKESRPSYDTERPSHSQHIKDARKLAIWHPHPDDTLPSWELW